MTLRPVLALLVVAMLSGCTASGASVRNFSLEPLDIGWFAGEEAAFRLNLEPTFSRSEPTYAIDRQFAIEEVRFKEVGVGFGGDFKTRDPDAVALRLMRGEESADAFTMDAANPTIDIFLSVPSDLKDSTYVLEVKLFKVGWVKSDAFRIVDRPRPASL